MNILASALIRGIEAMFITGVLGSSIVVLLTSMEDFKMLFEDGVFFSRRQKSGPELGLPSARGSAPT